MTDVNTPKPTEAPTSVRYLRRTEAASYITATYNIPCSPKTLAKLACVSSDGPAFRKAGRFPLYPVSELDAWARRKVGPLMKSTTVAAEKLGRGSKC
jgi:hypothetical protein